MLNTSEKEDIYELSKELDIKIGEIITGQYSTDIDILKIHMIIRDIFSYYNSNIDEKKEVILQLKKELEKKELSTIEKRLLIRKIESQNNLFKKYSKNNWNIYCKLSKEILNNYNKVTTYKKKKTITIGSKKKDEGEYDKDLLERLDLIRRYLNIAKEYIICDIVYYPPYQIGCSECNLTIEQMNIDEEQGVYICNCNSIFGNIYSVETSNIDPDRIDIGLKPSYDDKTNFIRRLKNYQGVQSKKISKELIDFLDKHLQEKYQHPPSEEIRKMSADKYGHRGSFTSVALLKEVLRETNNSFHFQDINLICYELWGWNCPDIEHLIPKIIDDYIKTQEVYKRLNPSFSSINVELRLYWHLRIAGHECIIDDFKIPQSRDSKKRNSEIFQIMCKETGLEFFPIL